MSNVEFGTPAGTRPVDDRCEACHQFVATRVCLYCLFRFGIECGCWALHERVARPKEERSADGTR